MGFFFDPLTRGPLLASSILALLLSLVGVITFHSKKPLLGEVVAHCSYPGAILGLLVSVFIGGIENPALILFVAFVFALIGLFVLKKIEGLITEDSSMTLVLSGFFGLGVLLTSILQQTYPKFYRLAQGYLFGQVSTMTDFHILVYGVVFVLTCLCIVLSYSRLSLKLFDPLQAKLLSIKPVDYLIEILICLALVVGIRGIGVVLVSSFFVAPSVVTLKFCKTLKSSFIAACVLACVLNYLAFMLAYKVALAPIIVLLLSFCALMALKKRSYASLS